jgi:hypothetical protein
MTRSHCQAISRFHDKHYRALTFSIQPSLDHENIDHSSEMTVLIFMYSEERC